MLMKKPKHRVFDYTPRFYKPEKDEEERRKRKLGFRRQLKSKRRQTNPFVYLLFIMVAVYIILKLSGSI
jgi:hypothetical protein